MYKSEAYLTKDISYVKNKNTLSGLRGQKVFVDVAESVVLVNGDHVHIEYDEYILTTDYKDTMPLA